MRLPVAAFALALVACGGDSPQPAPTATRPPSVEVLAQNVEFGPGPERAFVAGIGAFGGTADYLVTFRPEGARVTVCPLPAPDAALPPLEQCRRAVGSGVRESIGGTDLGALAFVVETGARVNADVLLVYDEASRDVTFRLPAVPDPPSVAACRDNACNPFFEVRPTRSGDFSARATFQGPVATLVLLQGSVLGRSFTATGVPYREASKDDGRGPLSVSARLSAPAEYALALVQSAGPGRGPLRDVRIEASWP